MAKLMDDGEWMLGRIKKCRRKKVHAIAGERADAGDPKREIPGTGHHRMLRGCPSR